MTKSTITRERAQQIFLGNGPEPSASEERELARMALAAMDSEPDCKERKLFCSTDTTRMRKTISVSAGTEDAPLYRHAQQPVVSAELLHTAASAIEDLLTTKDRMGVYVCFDLPFRLRSAANAQPAPVAYSDFESFWSSYIHPLAQDDELKGFAWDIWCAAMLQAGNSPVIPDGWTGNDKANAALMMLDRIETADPVDDDRIDGIKRIVRELAAAPHDTPALNSVQSVVTVPGKWIPVSERMPEVGVKVLCFPAEDEPIHAVFNGQLWLQDVSWSGSEEPIDNVIPVTVTHWMPLPAGPQEVK
ncbi:DUF551 domain-containing protein [Klebsiella pneumoniae]|uniref:DUF551 domain-containing protein n=1 Tax=Klebsiella pneumoniae TaxID=573 RepID=UPI003CC8DFA7